MTISCSAVQLSDAVAYPVMSGETEDSQLIVAAGGQVRVGFSRSVIVINCLQLVLLPHASVIVQVLSITPVWLQPDGTISISLNSVMRSMPAVQLSLDTGVPVTAGAMPCAQSTVISAGQVTTGVLESVMVIH